MAGYLYLRDKIWTPSGRVIIPPLIKEALHDQMSAKTITTYAILSRDATSGKTIYIMGVFNFDPTATYKLSASGVSMTNTIVKTQTMEIENRIILDDAVNFNINLNDLVDMDTILSNSEGGMETALILRDAISGPMDKGSQVIITQSIPAPSLPVNCSFLIDSIMANNPSEFTLVLKAFSSRDLANGNFGPISFTDRDALSVAAALNGMPNIDARLDGYTNATDVVILNFTLKAITKTIVPEWDLVLPTSDELKSSLTTTPYVIDINSDTLTQAIVLR